MNTLTTSRKAYNKITDLLFFLIHSYKKLREGDCMTIILFEGENIYKCILDTINQLSKILIQLTIHTKSDQEKLVRLYIFINNIERIFLYVPLNSYDTFQEIRYILNKKITVII